MRIFKESGEGELLSAEALLMPCTVDKLYSGARREDRKAMGEKRDQETSEESKNAKSLPTF